MPRLDSSPTPLLDNWLRKERAERFEPDPTPEEILAQNLEPYRIETALGPVTFWGERVASLICPACEDGDHTHSWICEADYKCACACHGPAPRKPAAREIDYERLGYELAIGSEEAA